MALAGIAPNAVEPGPSVLASHVVGPRLATRLTDDWSIQTAIVHMIGSPMKMFTYGITDRMHAASSTPLGARSCRPRNLNCKLSRSASRSALKNTQYRL